MKLWKINHFSKIIVNFKLLNIITDQHFLDQIKIDISTLIMTIILNLNIQDTDSIHSLFTIIIYYNVLNLII